MIGWWTDERVEQLKTLHAQGVSSSRIAAQMGAQSRNAIIGKVHRMGLPSPYWANRPVKEPRPPRVPKNRGAEHHMRTRIIEGGCGSVRVVRMPRLTADQYKFRCVGIVCETTIIDVTGCRFPGEGNGPHLFCNGPQRQGSSYCVAHHDVAYTPTRRQMAVAA